MSDGALSGIERSGMLVAPRNLVIAGTAGYGVVEGIDDSDDTSHHRVLGRVALGVRPLSWLATGVELGGRLDRHGDDGMGSHTAGVGDPRLRVRAGTEITAGLQLGGELGVWFPGQDAPSLVPEATSVDALAMLAHAPPGTPLTWFGSLGFRWDNSAQAAPDPSSLRPSDRLTLGFSESNALLVGAGLIYALGPRIKLLAEATWDPWVGKLAPDLAKAPLMVAVGGRVEVLPNLAAELRVGARATGQPSQRAESPLARAEPRVLIMLGLRYAISFEPDHAEEPPHTVSPPPARTKASTTTLRGQLVDAAGQGVSEVQVTLTPHEGPPRQVFTDATGQYVFDRVPIGPAQLSAAAEGFASETWEVAITPDMPESTARPLTASGGTGALKGLVRSFESTPLEAKVEVRRGRKRVGDTTANIQGRFELTLDPGKYQVEISAPGFVRQQRTITVETGGITILNVDLGKRSP